MYCIYKYIAFLACICCCGLAQAHLNLAVIAPVNGDSSQIGSEIVSGVKAAVNEINDEGGLLGEKVNLLVIEDECQDSLSLSTAQMMALNTDSDYKASAVIGPYCFNQFQAITDTFAQAGIFQIIPTAVNASYEQNGHSGLVKMVGYQAQQATDFFNYYNEHFNNLRVALIGDIHHQDIARAVEDIFAQNNKTENLLSYHFEDYKFNYDDIAEKAVADGTQMAFILGDAESANEMARALKIEQNGYIIFVNRYQVAPDFEDIMGDLAEDCYLIGLPSLTDSPEFTETLVKLRLLGIEPEGLAVYGYSATKLWADLVKKSKSFSYNKLAQALKSNSFDSGWGRLMFTNGNPVDSINYSIYQYQNGEYAQVY